MRRLRARSIRVRAAVLPLLLLSSCTSMWRGQVGISRVSFDPPRCEVVWAIALEELARRSFPIEVADRARGLIRTKRVVRPGRVPCGLFTCRHRDQVEVTVAPDGALSVRIDRELAYLLITGFPTPGAMESWGPPSRWQTKTLDGIAADQEELARAIAR